MIIEILRTCQCDQRAKGFPERATPGIAVESGTDGGAGQNFSWPEAARASGEKVSGTFSLPYPISHYPCPSRQFSMIGLTPVRWIA
jgi:hypothetical protein